jgi:hypothetical protein
VSLRQPSPDHCQGGEPGDVGGGRIVVSLRQQPPDHCQGGEPGDVGGGRTAVSLSQPSPDHCQGGEPGDVGGGRTAVSQRANHNLTNAKNSRESDASGTSFFKTYLNIVLVECIYKAKCLHVRFYLNI